MNKAYRLIWSSAKDAWVIAAEIVKGNGGPPPITVGAIMVAASLGLAASGANALPTTPTVVNGNVTFSTTGNTLTVTNSPNSIINWQGFSIAANETARFNQQNSASAVLNRVTGLDPSSILGALQSNGRVFLLNPNGIIFGQGSRIDVAGLVASSLGMSNQDFLAASYRFSAGATAGAVKNEGTITTTSGGMVWLISPNVENSGVITSPNGSVMLAAGQSVNMVDPQRPEIAVLVSAPTDQAVNMGTILAQGGNAGIFGALVNQQGIVNADAAVAGPGGRIFLRSTMGTTLGATSVTSASGTNGGNITIQSTTGDTLVSGSVNVSGSSGTGGAAHILGNRVALTGAAVDASGTTGGGTVLVGGDYQGRNLAVQNAEATFVSSDSVITADALFNGNGGKIVVWSNGSTKVHGRLTARGGSQGGDGGLIETSGHFLDVRGIKVDASAKKGKAGNWLLDPYNVEIGDFSSDYYNGNISYTSFTPTGSGSYVDATFLGNTLANTNVTVSTYNLAGAELGNITVSAPVSWGTSNQLTLQADNDIYINAPITATDPNATLVLNAQNNATQTAPITAANLLLLNGNFDLQHPANAVNTLTAGDSMSIAPGYGAGNITFVNSQTLTVGGAAFKYGVGINSIGDVSLTARGLAGQDGLIINQPINAVNVTLKGYGGDSDAARGGHGVYVGNYINASGNVYIKGQGGRGGAGIYGGNGIHISDSSSGSTYIKAQGNITLKGFGGNGGVGGAGGYGISSYISSANGAAVESQTSVDITAKGGFGNNGSGIQQTGFYDYYSSTIVAAPIGTITAEGGFTLYGAFNNVTLNNSGSGDIYFAQSSQVAVPAQIVAFAQIPVDGGPVALAQAPLTGFTVSGSNTAPGGGFTVANDTGSGIIVAGITTANGPVKIAAGDYYATGNGNVTFTGAINAGTGAVSIYAYGGNSGPITPGAINGAGGFSSINAGSLTLISTDGIGTSANPFMTAVSSISATNTNPYIPASPGTITPTDINISNTGALTVSGITNNGGSITVDNIGAVTVAGNVTAGSGIAEGLLTDSTISMTAHSPLTVNSGVLVSGVGAVALTAGASGLPTDNLLVNGDITSQKSNITLQAGNTVTTTGVLSAPNGTVLVRQNMNPPTPPPPAVVPGTTPVTLPDSSLTTQTAALLPGVTEAINDGIVVMGRESTDQTEKDEDEKDGENKPVEGEQHGTEFRSLPYCN